MPKTDIAKALERSLDLLGEPSKKALLFHLTHTFKIPIDRKSCSLEEIEDALRQILGEGASLVVASINNELEQETR
jgi:hypothetical protein